MKDNLTIAKEIIKENFKQANCGIFFCKNWYGDPMETVYKNDEIMIDICYRYSYYEVFGLNEEEQEELAYYYAELLEA